MVKQEEVLLILLLSLLIVITIFTTIFIYKSQKRKPRQRHPREPKNSLPTQPTQSKDSYKISPIPSQAPVEKPKELEKEMDLYFKGLTKKQATTILKLTSIFENSTPELQYGYAENIGDGRGITFGFAGFTTGTFDGNMVLKEYRRLKPDNLLSKYIPVLDRIDSQNYSGLNNDTSGLEGFEESIKIAAKDPFFRKAQNNIANKLYIAPSQKKAYGLGLKLPITRGELYDSYINHGESGTIDIIKKVKADTGNEREWLKEFLYERYKVLASDRTWALSVDRINAYKKILASGNVYLNEPIRIKVYGQDFVLFSS